jgi:hypothetical protein
MSFDYKVPEDGLHKRFVYDGERAYMDLDLGNMAFFNRRGANEVYRAYRIELHFPSEHYVTMFNQTPRYALELQIFHHFVASSNSQVTDKFLKVNKAVISILYTVGPVEDGDEFLEQLGISSKDNVNPLEYNRDDTKVPITALPKENIAQGNIRVGLYDTGFN